MSKNKKDKKETKLLTPEEVKMREIEEFKRTRKPAPSKELVSTDTDVVVDDKGSVILEDEDESKELHNRAGRVCVNFETMGRFSLPRKMYFEDFTIKDVNDLTLSRQEDLLENLVTILNKLKNDDADIDVADATMEEFMEILISMKQQFVSTDHEHIWICSCQDYIAEAEKQTNETIINLAELHYSSIEDADESIRNFYKKGLVDFTKEEYDKYLLDRYDGERVAVSWTVEQELQDIKIQEPFNVPIGKEVYAFRFMRVRDILDAFKIARKEFAGKIKKIQNEKTHGIPLVQVKEDKKEKTDKLKEEEARAAILYSKALTLQTIDKKELSNKEKIENYQKIPRPILFEIVRFQDKLTFGVDDERDLTCPICGELNRRSLQQGFNPIEFLPFDTSTESDAQVHSRPNIYFGI